jgi:tRNA A-37 threonylcarbamoyl transferase component Bud32
VEDGTLEKHLRDNTRALIEWKRQLKFAKEIAVAVFWLHHNKIIHGDLVNIIIFHSFKEMFHFIT